MIRLIVSDLDDTLIHKDEHLSEEVVEAVKDLRSRGIHLTFATGRMPYRAMNYVRDIGLKIPFVANNGSILHDGERMVFAKMLHALDLKTIIQKYMDRDPEFTVLFSYEDRERPLRVTHWIQDRLHKYPGYNQPLGCGDSVWEQDIHKIYVVDEQRTGLIGELAAELKALPELASCYQYGEFSMEIVAPGCSKATGAARLIAYMGCKKEEVMAIGDHTNDIEVLQLAGIGVAVGNAVPELRAVADHIMHEHRSKGVIEAIKRFT